MTIPIIETLIDKQDSMEIVRTNITDILAANVANQMALATAGGKDPALWDLSVYEERAAAWEQGLNETEPPVPIVNVWFESESFDRSRGNIKGRQTADGVFNIDVYGYGVTVSDGAGGQLPGDRAAALEAQRGMRLVRNILMAGGPMVYLGLQSGDVNAHNRWPENIQSFQPQINDTPVMDVVGMRLAFAVSYNEVSPQPVADVLEEIGIEIKRQSDGLVVAEIEIDFTP